MDFSFITLFLGLFLGIKHAFEADHIIAVSTIASDQKNHLKAALIGTFWGMGHTTTLFLVGLIVLLTKVDIPDVVSLLFEFFVGCMLVILGIRTLIVKEIIHTHAHAHKGVQHIHPHEHDGNLLTHSHYRSFFIGTIHGLAGSGALMLLVLSTIKSTVVGLYYILIFGIGSIIGMTLMSFLFRIPYLLVSKKLNNFDKLLRKIAGICSIGFGLFMMYGTASLLILI